MLSPLLNDKPIHPKKRSTISTSAACETSCIIRGTDRRSQLPTTSFPAIVAQVLKTWNERFAGTSSIPTSWATPSRAQSLMTPCSSLTSRTFDDLFSALTAFSAARERRPSNLQKGVQYFCTMRERLSNLSTRRFILATSAFCFFASSFHACTSFSRHSSLPLHSSLVAWVSLSSDFNEAISLI